MKKKPQTIKEKIIHESTPERVNAFSDGVFAIIITIMVLELIVPVLRCTCVPMCRG